ncbi:hypothetical protein [Vreelandella arcis]|nr:hypothetical protein [Halomonas arcis]
MRQHEFYAAQTATALQFPIKLVLTLNATLMAASLLLAREAVQAGDLPQLINASQIPMTFFGLGVICVLISSWFQWKLYSKIMYRKRQILKAAVKASNWVEAVSPFVNELEKYGKTWYQGACYTFVAVSFFFFLGGVFNLARVL